MRFLKYLFLAAVAVVLVVLALANRDAVMVEVIPADLAAWVGWSYSIELPLFLVIFGGIVLGLMIGYVLEYLREHKHRSAANRERRERTKLEREVESLKGRANEGRDEILALLDDGGRTG